MENEKIISSLERFSGSLLVMVFAIFAFTSSALISTNQIWVKILFLTALCLAILSLVWSYRALSIPINSLVGEEVDEVLGKQVENKTLSVTQRQKMIKYVRWQWRISITALVILALAVGVFLFTDNTSSVKVTNFQDISLVK